MSACDGWRLALLEGEPTLGLAAHVASCTECGLLRQHIELVEREAALLEVPPVPARLVATLQRQHADAQDQFPALVREFGQHRTDPSIGGEPVSIGEHQALTELSSGTPS
jgi:hypothetical protein